MSPFEPFGSDYTKGEEKLLHVGGRGQGLRLDSFVARYLPLFSRREVQDLINDCRILVNGREKKQAYRVHFADRISLSLPLKRRFHEIGQNIPLQIIYEDDWLVAINKPAGLPVHPVAGNLTNTIMNALAHHFQSCDRPPTPVHRLDRDVSGLLLTARNAESAHLLSKLFLKRQVIKTYIAVVEGRVGIKHGVIDHALEQRSSRGLSTKTAETYFRTLKHLGDYTFILFRPQTGRKHQIRRHAALLGHPIVNDPRYGTAAVSSHRLWLHAARLHFFHPFRGVPMTLVAPCPEEMKLFIRNLPRSTYHHKRSSETE